MKSLFCHTFFFFDPSHLQACAPQQDVEESIPPSFTEGCGPCVTSFASNIFSQNTFSNGFQQISVDQRGAVGIESPQYANVSAAMDRIQGLMNQNQALDLSVGSGILSSTIPKSSPFCDPFRQIIAGTQWGVTPKPGNLDLQDQWSGLSVQNSCQQQHQVTGTIVNNHCVKPCFVER
jgi:hypothetical protein